MITVDAQLRVALKGADLAATTAQIALVDKMGFGSRLLGLRRFDYFRFRVETGGDPMETVNSMRRVLDRQSTFYNRNKHLYSLDCRWDGGGHRDGVSVEELRERWAHGLVQAMERQGVGDSGGKESPNRVILNVSNGFLVEVVVEDDDPAARTSVAARLESGLAAPGNAPDAKVECINRATAWWLAVCASDRDAALSIARDITVTTSRDHGLLMNPNYQSVEFVFAEPIQG